MSAHIRTRKHFKTTQLATLVTLAFPVVSHAQQAVTLPEVKVQAAAEATYKTEQSANPKYTQPLLDTPQTISVIKKEILQEQGATTLAEALRNTPGITMQLGENGNTSAGDAFSMRGFSVQNSIFVDGVRDVSPVTRDIYNYDQVEVIKGPAGGDIGRGATPGYINLITKLPGLEDSNFVTGGVNTESGTRFTADLNKKVGDTSAVRINAMTQNTDVAERSYVENSGYAFAPSFATGLGTQSRFYLYAQVVRQDNVPDGGISTIGMPGYRGVDMGSPANDAAATNAPRVNRNNFYGDPADYEKVRSDMVTAKYENDLAPGMTLRNISRFGTSKMDRQLTSVLDVIVNDPNNLNSWEIERRRQRVDQKNEIIANQTNLTANFATGAIKHSLTTGLELMSESQRTTNYGVPGNDPGVTDIDPGNLYHPVPGALPEMFKNGSYVDGKTTTVALYAFDTLTLNDNWQLNGGLRYEHYNTRTNQSTLIRSNNVDYWNGVLGAGTVAPGDLVPESASEAGNLLSWKVAAVYKPAHNGSVYAAFANSYLPPGGGSFNLATASSENSADGSNLDPQQSKNIEFGTKWDLLNKRLNLTAAIYRTENKNEMVHDSITDEWFQEGKRRVDGVELGLIGQITSAWQVSAGIAHMKSEILSGQQDGSDNTGSAIRWTPEWTATLWNTYTMGPWSLGGGFRYVSDQTRVTDTTADPAETSMAEIPSYVVWDAMLSYRMTKNAALQLNLYNLADKLYINTLNNGGTRMVLGQPRSALLTATLQF